MKCVVAKVKKNVMYVTVRAKLIVLIVMEMESKSVLRAMVLENVDVEIVPDLVQLMTMTTISVNIDT